MVMLRTLACAVVLLLTATESVAAEAWRIVQSAGAVKAGGAGFMPAAVRPNQTLPADAWVETGTAGRVVLVRGLEAIALGPNSRVQLPSQEVNGNTQVLQTIGSALYQVGKQKAPHFQVDTPYLAALVKGTTFTITVTDAGSSVDVSEGLVQVATPDGSDTEFVQPGFSGIVTKRDLGSVIVVGTSEAPALPHATPSGDEKAAGKVGANDGKGTVIAAAIGEVVLDVKAVSGGLATSVDAPPGVAPEKGEPSVDSKKDGPTKSDVVLSAVGGEATGVVAKAPSNGNGIGIGAGIALDLEPGGGVGGGNGNALGNGKANGKGIGAGLIK